MAFNFRGNAYRSKGRYDRAIQDFDQAIGLSPNYAAAYFGRALAYQDKMQWDFDAYLDEERYEDRALKDYDEAIRLAPGNRAAYNNRGNVYKSKRQYGRAIKDYDEAIRLDPDEAMYVKNRGNAFRVTGQYDRAVADYRKVLTLKVDEPVRRSRSRRRSRSSARPVERREATADSSASFLRRQGPINRARVFDAPYKRVHARLRRAMGAETTQKIPATALAYFWGYAKVKVSEKGCHQAGTPVSWSVWR